MYLRPLVGSLLAIVAAILLYGSNYAWDFLDRGVALAAAHGKKVSILVTTCLLLKLHEFAIRRPASRAPEPLGDPMHERALVHVKEDLSLGPAQSAFRYAEGSYMSVFESQKLLKKSRIS
jgi:hypothetical protein